MTTITEAETASLKFHLNYGAISADAEPYVDFHALFTQVIQPNLTHEGPDTFSLNAIAVGQAIVTPDDMEGIVPHRRLVIDVGDDAEIVTVMSTTVLVNTFVARHTKPHPAGVPILALSGASRLRMLLHRADQAHAAINDPTVGATAGLKQVDKGDVVWMDGFRAMRDRQAHYRAIVDQISSLVRVSPLGAGGATRTSVY